MELKNTTKIHELLLNLNNKDAYARKTAAEEIGKLQKADNHILETLDHAFATESNKYVRDAIADAYNALAGDNSPKQLTSRVDTQGHSKNDSPKQLTPHTITDSPSKKILTVRYNNMYRVLRTVLGVILILLGVGRGIYELRMGRISNLIEGISIILIPVAMGLWISLMPYMKVNNDSLWTYRKTYKFQSYKELEIESNQIFLNHDGKREKIKVSAKTADQDDWQAFMKLIREDPVLLGNQLAEQEFVDLQQEIMQMNAAIDVEEFREFRPTDSKRYIKALSVIDLIKYVFQIYREQFLNLLIISTVVGVISYLTIYTDFYYLGFIGQVAGAVIVLVCSRSILNKPIKLIELFRNLYFSPFIWTIVLFSFFLLPLIVIGLFFVTSGVLSELVTGLVEFLFIFFSSIVLTEKKGFRDALKKFFFLLTANFWNIVSKFSIGYLIYAVITQIMIYLLVGINELFWLSMGGNFSPAIMGTIANIFCSPIINLVGVFVYYDARVRKENFTQELLAQEMGYRAINEMITT